MPRRLLVVTPYAPGGSHFHAAADLAGHLADGLARDFELHVAAPMGEPAEAVGFRLHTLPAPAFTKRDYFGLLPAATRMDWPAAATAAVLRLVREIEPDHIHFEYLQSAEAALGLDDGTWSLTLHDVGERVFSDRAKAATGLEGVYRRLESVRVRRIERRVIRSAGRVFVFAERDASHVRNLGGNPQVIRVGTSLPPVEWSHPADGHPVLLFAAAMSRDVNARAARWLVHEVMPHVWANIPEVRLRLVGDGSDQILAGDPVDDRIEQVGRVTSFDAEFVAASVVLAPSLVGAGVLLKAVKGMAAGAPVVLTSHSAAPFLSANGEIALVGDTSKQFASAAVYLIQNPEEASAMGKRARAFVAENHSWPAAVRAVSDGLVGLS